MAISLKEAGWSNQRTIHHLLRVMAPFGKISRNLESWSNTESNSMINLETQHNLRTE